MESKKPWESLTFWAKLVMAILGLFTDSGQEFLVQNPKAAFGGALGVGALLRAKTNTGITLKRKK